MPSDCRPRLIGCQVVPPSSVRNTPAAEIATNIRWSVGRVEQDRVQAHAAGARLPRGPGAVLAQAGQLRPGRAAVGRCGTAPRPRRRRRRCPGRAATVRGARPARTPTGAACRRTTGACRDRPRTGTRCRPGPRSAPPSSERWISWPNQPVRLRRRRAGRGRPASPATWWISQPGEVRAVDLPARAGSRRRSARTRPCASRPAPVRRSWPSPLAASSSVASDPRTGVRQNRDVLFGQGAVGQWAERAEQVEVGLDVPTDHPRPDLVGGAARGDRAGQVEVGRLEARSGSSPSPSRTVQPGPRVRAARAPRA